MHITVITVSKLSKRAAPGIQHICNILLSIIISLALSSAPLGAVGPTSIYLELVKLKA